MYIALVRTYENLTTLSCHAYTRKGTFYGDFVLSYRSFYKAENKMTYQANCKTQTLKYV